MPGFDGTGPRGQGPMTGQGMGFCVLKESKDKPGQINGFAGLQGMPVSQYGYRPFCAAIRFMYDRNFGFGRGFRGGRGRLGR